MRRFIAGAVTGVVLASAVTATAVGFRTIQLRAGDKAKFAGMQCSANTLSTSSFFSCVSMGKLGVTYGTDWVSVVRFRPNGTSKTVYSGNQ